jgi:hypothetical protein
MQQFVSFLQFSLLEKHSTPKTEADADHCIAEGAEILVRHT